MAGKSSKRWLQEHFSDPYVKQAQQAGYRSRAVYKLIELEERYHLFKPGMTVIDLGAAPGGWSQLLVKWVGSKGRVIALDILPMEPIPNVQFIQGDFTEEAVLQQVLSITDQVNWVVSDMAPNISGNESVDIPRSVYLAELAFELAMRLLQTGNEGGLLLKIFQGEGCDAFIKTLKTHFKSVMICKPKASRGRSREVYVLARQFLGDSQG